MLVERWREMPPWRKAELVSALSRDCERLAVAGIRERHPGATPEEQRLRLAALRIGPELARRAYGWDPVERGL